jgi:hypothetical protein
MSAATEIAVIDTATLQALREFPERLRAHYRAIPGDCIHWVPSSWEGIPSEPFTAIEQVWHVFDIEVEGYQARFRRTLQEDAPLLPSIDSEAVAAERRYGERDAAAALDGFAQARAQTLDLIASLDDAAWARPATFEGYGPTTLRSLVHFLCSHDQQHLAGLQWLLGQIAAAEHARRA